MTSGAAAGDQPEAGSAAGAWPADGWVPEAWSPSAAAPGDRTPADNRPRADTAAPAPQPARSLQPAPARTKPATAQVPVGERTPRPPVQTERRPPTRVPRTDCLDGRWLAGHLPQLVATAVTIIAVAGYGAIAHGLWFFGDDWAFLLREHVDWHDLMTPHNEHWSAVPLIVFRVLYSGFGLHSYRVFALPVLLAHAVICFVLWRLARRAGAGPWAACGGVVLMAICGGGTENLEWDFQIGFVGSVMFGLIAVLLADRESLSRRRTYGVWAVSVLALMCSGIGVAMLIVLIVLCVLRAGWRSAVRTTWVPVGVYLLWYAAYGRAGTADDHTGLVNHAAGAGYFWNGLTNVWQTNTGIPASGFVLLVLLFAPILGRRASDRLARLALACGAGAVTLYAMTAWTRIRFGIEQATASRYVYIATALTIPAVIWGLGALARRGRASDGRASEGDGSRWAVRPTQLVAIAAVVLCAANMVSVANTATGRRRTMINVSKTRILAGAALAVSGERLLNTYPDHTLSRDITAAELARAVRQGKLSVPPVTPSALLAERLIMQVAAQPRSAGLPTVTELTNGPNIVRSAAGRCQPVSLLPSQRLTFVTGRAGGQLRILPPGSQVVIWLAAGGQVTTDGRALQARPGAPMYLASTVPNARLLFSFPSGGTLRLCP